MKIKTNVVSAHLTATFAALFSIAALLHPGFKVPVVVQAIGTSLPIIVAGAIEAYHLLTHRQLQAALAAIATTVKVAENAATPAATTSGPTA
jgi:hypothetical protein